MTKHEPSKEQGVAWEEVRAAVASQPEAEPSPEVRDRVLAEIRVREAEDLAPPPSWWTWAGGVAAAVLVTALLWAALRPGIVVSWTAQTAAPATLHLQRATARGEFRTLHTFPTERAAQRYRYVDGTVWPWRTYVYRVEARLGDAAIEQHTLTVPGHVALAGQLAVVITGALVGYGSVLLVQRQTRLERPLLHR